MTGLAPARSRGARLLLGRVSGTAGSIALGQLILGLTYVCAARSMGPASLGLVATCVAIGTVGSAIFDLGLASYQVREVASGRLTPARARATNRVKRRLVPLLVGPAAAACILIMSRPVEGVVLGLTGWAVWESKIANSALLALERFSRAATAQLGGRLVGLGATASLLLAERPELALAVGLVAGFLVEAVVDRRMLGPVPRTAATPASMLDMHRRSAYFGLVSLAGVGQQLDTPVVTAGGGAAAGGIYAGAGRLVGPLLFLSTSLALVAGPWLAGTRDDQAALRGEERRVMQTALGLSLAPLAAATLGPTLIPLVLGAGFHGSGIAFSVLAVGAAFSTVNQAVAIILQNRGREKAVGHAIGIGLVLGLVSSYGLAVVGGPVWAAVGFTVTQLYILAHMAVALRPARCTGPGKGDRRE